MRARTALAVFIASIVPCVVVPLLALASPPAGTGVYLGAGSHTNETAIGGMPQTYDSGGFTLGFDYQFPVSEHSSFNLLYLLWIDSSPVTNELPLDTATIMESNLALQARFWPTESMFVGAHLGLYSQSLTFDIYVPEDGFGLGWGVVGGLEMEVTPSTRLTLTAQYDRVPSMKVMTGFDATDLSGFTLLVGLRFVRP